MTTETLEIKRVLNCSEEDAEALVPGGRIERGCNDPEAASAILGMLAGEVASSEPPAQAVEAILDRGGRQ